MEWLVVFSLEYFDKQWL